MPMNTETAAMELEWELATYKRKLPELLMHTGRFALIKGDDVDIFDSYGDALKAGYERFRLDRFMVKKIGAKPLMFSREIVLCR
jgi:hypothetical protein